MPLALIKKTTELKRIFLLLLIILQLISCDNGVDYIKQKDGENHLIDFGKFSIIIPTDFKYKKVNGIDSYVGEIRNGKSTFFFDYGWYSPKAPMTKKQFIDDNRKHLDFESTQVFFNLIDLKPYQNEKGAINPRDITKKIKNVVLRKTNDSVILDKGQDKKCEYYYTFDFEKKKYKIPFCIPQENLDNFKYYDIKIDTINNYQRTLSIWKNESSEKYSSVNLIPINSDSNKMELSIGINTNGKMKTKKIGEILKTVELRNN